MNSPYCLHRNLRGTAGPPRVDTPSPRAATATTTDRRLPIITPSRSYLIHRLLHLGLLTVALSPARSPHPWRRSSKHWTKQRNSYLFLLPLPRPNTPPFPAPGLPGRRAWPRARVPSDGSLSRPRLLRWPPGTQPPPKSFWISSNSSPGPSRGSRGRAPSTARLYMSIPARNKP